MRRKLLFVAISSFLISMNAIKAQEAPKDTIWTKSGFVGLKFTQVSFSNWASGGDNAVAFDLQGNYQANYKRGKHLWNNRLEVAYGLSNTKTDGTRKTNDKLYLNTNYGYSIYKNLYLSALANFQTQFTNGYDYSVDPDVSISEFMAPGYLTVGAGLLWTPNKIITVTFSPAAYKGTFVLNDRLSDEGAYGVTPGKKVLSEFGADLKIEANYEFMKNMNLYSRLGFYSAYTHNPQNVDISWDVQLNMTINKWFSTSVTTNLVYDDDVKILQKDGRKVSKIQFKEVFGVGLQFNF